MAEMQKNGPLSKITLTAVNILLMRIVGLLLSSFYSLFNILFPIRIKHIDKSDKNADYLFKIDNDYRVLKADIHIPLNKILYSYNPVFKPTITITRYYAVTFSNADHAGIHGTGVLDIRLKETQQIDSIKMHFADRTVELKVIIDYSEGELMVAGHDDDVYVIGYDATITQRVLPWDNFKE
jgi:hypothetical protein